MDPLWQWPQLEFFFSLTFLSYYISDLFIFPNNIINIILQFFIKFSSFNLKIGFNTFLTIIDYLNFWNQSKNMKFYSFTSLIFTIN